jgi:TonB dependent receptor
VGSRQSLFGAYVQDDWRVRSNLTVNLGLRYEPTTLPTEAHDRFQSIVDFYGGPPVPVHTLWQRNQTLRNFAPRVGFSWDPFHDGKTAIRGGFGIYDVLPINWVYGNTATASSYPFANNVSVSGLPPDSFPDAALPYLGVVNIAKAQARYVEQDPKNSYSLNWNINIQREIVPTLTLTVGFVGSHSVHQANTPNDMDMVLPTLTSAGYLWPFPVGSGTEFNTSVGSIRPTTWGGSSSYSGLQTQLRKQMTHGILAQASYTFGKCIDYGSAAQVGDPFLNSITSFNWLDPASIRGLCDFNVQHNFVANFIWDIPHPTVHGIAEYAFDGWELGGIFTAATGTPFTVVMGGDPLGMKGSAPNSRPDRLANCGAINGNFKSDNLDYLNVGCFTPPTAPASFAGVCQPAAASVAAVIPNTCMNLYGNSGRNSLVGPGLVDLDFMVIKNTRIRKISEAFNVQFRAEFFNILNHPNFQPPLDNLTIFNQNGTSVSGAGAIDATTTDPRQIQLALKVIW